MGTRSCPPTGCSLPWELGQNEMWPWARCKIFTCFRNIGHSFPRRACVSTRLGLTSLHWTRNPKGCGWHHCPFLGNPTKPCCGLGAHFTPGGGWELWCGAWGPRYPVGGPQLSPSATQGITLHTEGCAEDQLRNRQTPGREVCLPLPTGLRPGPSSRLLCGERQFGDSTARQATPFTETFL